MKDCAEPWPTPTGDDANNVTRRSGDFQSLTRSVAHTESARRERGGQGSMGSKHNAERGYLDGVVAEQWPTPSANEDAAGTPAGNMQKMLGNHPGVRGETPQEWATGSLNPAWVDALMGYPIGYTEPEGEPLLHMPQRWPAGLGAPQHEWEPPRLTCVKENRANRLKALGNSIVPQCARLWLAAIQEEDERG